jgi:hypothetical protein
MKLSRKRLNRLIKESISKKLFESAYKEKLKTMTQDQLLGIDTSSLTPEELEDYIDVMDEKLSGQGQRVVDDFADEPTSSNKKGVSRRNFMKGLGVAAAAAGGGFALSKFNVASDALGLETPTFDLNNPSDLAIFAEGMKELAASGEFAYINYDRSITDQIFSGLKQCTPRQLIKISMPIIAKELTKRYNELAPKLSEKAKLTLSQLHYEYISRAANYVGIVFAEELFQLVYMGPYKDMKISFLPESITKELIVNDDGELYDSILEKGYMDTVFVAQDDPLSIGQSFWDRVRNGTGEEIGHVLTKLLVSDNADATDDPQYIALEKARHDLYDEIQILQIRVQFDYNTMEFKGSQADIDRLQELRRESMQLDDQMQKIEYRQEIMYGLLYDHGDGAKLLMDDGYTAGIAGVSELTGEDPNQ